MLRSINPAGIGLIKAFESFCAVPYQDSKGVWTIGYGHTKNVKKDTSEITEAQAEQFLRQDIADAEEEVAGSIRVPLSDNQYAALVSLVYNVGSAPLTHMLGIKLNAQDYKGAADEFLKWHYADGVSLEGLMRRRQAERALFLSND